MEFNHHVYPEIWCWRSLPANMHCRSIAGPDNRPGDKVHSRGTAGLYCNIMNVIYCERIHEET